MAIGKSKLSAFMGKGSPAQAQAKGPKGPPPGKADLKDAGHKPDEEDEDLETGYKNLRKESGYADEDMKEGGLGQFSQLIPILEEFAHEIEEAAEENDPEALDEEDLPEDEEEILENAVATLNNKLRKGMADAFRDGLTRDQAHELAEHLESEEAIDDPEPVGNWLYHASKTDLLARKPSKSTKSGRMSAKEEAEEEEAEGEA